MRPLPFVRRSRLEAARQAHIATIDSRKRLTGDFNRLRESNTRLAVALREREAQAARLERGIETYLKVTPGKKGHGAARQELAALVGPQEG